MHTIPNHGRGANPKTAKHKERGFDLYETPVEATLALMKIESLPWEIWEPAAGRGAIVDVLKTNHFIIAHDLVDYGRADITPGRDFLMERRAPAGTRAIVTNPPYLLAADFVRHGLELGVRHVIMLLRLAFLEGKGRSDILDGGKLARVHVFRNRLPMMHRDGWEGPKTGSATAYAWFVWDREHVGATEIRRLSWERNETSTKQGRE